MDIDGIRTYCLSLPHATEDIQWGNDLLFRISGKIFAGMSLDPQHSFSFKCTPEKYEELIELDGIIPAPYMARNKWVMLENLGVLGDSETKRLISNSYEMIFSKLPKKTQMTLQAQSKTPVMRERKKPAARSQDVSDRKK